MALTDEQGNEFAKKRSRDYGCAASLAVIRSRNHRPKVKYAKQLFFGTFSSPSQFCSGAW